MSVLENTRPTVMSLSYHDPSGGGGLAADIETMASLGCHCTPVITSLAARDTQAVKDKYLMSPTFVIEQARAILEDMPVKVIKLGYLATPDTVEAVYTILRDYPNIPVVVDPRRNLHRRPSSERQLYSALADLIFPISKLVVTYTKQITDLTPNADNLEASAAVLLDTGCEHVLVNGCQENYQFSQTRLYGSNGLLFSQRWQRLNITCHGKSDILASAVSAYLAHNLSMTSAADQGLRYTWNALAGSQRLGMGMPIPNRMHWAKNSPKDYATEIVVTPDSQSPQ